MGVTALAPARHDGPPPAPPAPPAARPALSPRLAFARIAIGGVLVLSVSLLLELVVLSPLYHRSKQERLFANLREHIAKGTAALGPTDVDGREVRPGTPVAYIEIPSLHMKEVVVEGTSASDLFAGPGHRRDTPLPGQEGVSVVMGRRGAFGGPFAAIHSLRKGATIRVTTGQGKFVFRVTGVRRVGAPVPPAPAAGVGRLLLVTAGGRRYVPAGVVRVDAELTTPALPGPSRLYTSQTLPQSEQIMALDGTTVWALALWLQILVMLVGVATWAWRQWHHAKAWVLLLPPLILVGALTSGQAARLLPNLL